MNYSPSSTLFYSYRSLFLCFAVFFVSATTSWAQSRVNHLGQDLFLSGTNLAWNDFANDVGPGSTDLNHFRSVFDQMESKGGNIMRLWVHTNGVNTPAWNGSMVTGPGSGAINDLKNILDEAWDRKVGLMICLWSFDMLRTTNGGGVNNRSRDILTKTVNRDSYINNALTPMVQQLAGHPAIIAWEIFNEPEGMSKEHGWSNITGPIADRVSMANIQKFVNLCAGAIHRADPSAKVTNGAWSFISQTDVGPGNTNYYRDDRLIAAGGDPDGTLDFYCVHYYDWAGTERSPFHHDASHWGLNKPIVVAEFYPDSSGGGCVNCGSTPYQNLYNRGYAGALSWSWTDSNHGSILGHLDAMSSAHPDDVLIVDNQGPTVTLTSPNNGDTFPAGSSVTLQATASDADGSIARVEFFEGTTKLGEDTSAPYLWTWTNSGQGVFDVNAVAVDDGGLRTQSGSRTITVGEPPTMVRLQAEEASWTGAIWQFSDGNADQGLALRMEDSGSIVWTVNGIPQAGTYDVTIRYHLPYDQKEQTLSVNGGSSQNVVFPLPANAWREVEVEVTFQAGRNTVEIAKDWGYVDFDYIEVAIPSQAVQAPVELRMDLTFSGNNMIATFPTNAGRTYWIETSVDLQGWVSYPGAGSQTGDGGVMNIVLPNAASGSIRFFRLAASGN